MDGKDIINEVKGKGPGKKSNPPKSSTVAIDYNKIIDGVAAKLMPQLEQAVDARLAPIIMKSSGHSETGDLPVGGISPIILEDGAVAKGGVDLTAVDTPLHRTYLEELAFMEEFMVVTVEETGDPNAENPIMVGNNGIFVYFYRGIPMKVKRKFVDGLIVKSSRVTTPEYTNQAGERAFKIVQHPSHKYPFRVEEDRNPRGGEWLRRRLMESI